MSEVGGDSGVIWPGLLRSMALAATAGGLGWGIRGQYGHETGAMLAGVLVGYTLIALFAARSHSLWGARAVALFALGVGLGGCMTYGQTIGLTQDPALAGSPEAFRWGLLGLFVKGGIWIGWAGALLGMALSGTNYRCREMVWLFAGLLVLFAAGVMLLNRPFDPSRGVLPRIYFSADWHWQPTAELRPRPECWGGLLLALVALVLYARMWRGDVLAWNLACWGMLAGGVGFAGGQLVQAFHARHGVFFQVEPLSRLDQYVNWWNMMEITFGATWGALLACGLWCNRRWLASGRTQHPVAAATLSPGAEWVLALLYAAFVAMAEFSNQPVWELFLEFSLVMALLPLCGILGGRTWPYLFSLPLVALPLAGKTLRELVYQDQWLAPHWGWWMLVVVPLLICVVVAITLARQGERGQCSGTMARRGLLCATVLFVSWNFLFFRCPWPWQPWTGRTPSAIIFAGSAVVLVLFSVWPGRPICGTATQPR